MKNKKNVIIAVMCAVALLMATGYAYFATQLNINATGNITSQWNVYFESIKRGTMVGLVTNVVPASVSGTSANMNVNLSFPGDSIEYNIVLKNGGTVGASKTITVKIEYDPNTSSQPSETSKQLTVTIDAVQDIGQSITSQTPTIEGEYGAFARRVLNNNQAQSDKNIDFSQISSDTNGKGLYYTNVNTEDNKTTYYFRGNVENNYVKFGVYGEPIVYGYNFVNATDFKVFDSMESCQNSYDYNINCTVVYDIGDDIVWRIVRINEDESIRLVSQDIISYSSYSENGDNAYVGYMHGTAGSATYALTHENKFNSVVKSTLDAWYTKHLSSYANLFARDAGFCNDRSIATSANTWESDDTALGYGINVTYYGAYNRLYKNNKPQFDCPNESNDLFTTSTSSKGNKKLSSPIGLLTADEVVYAGGDVDIANSNYYLSNGVGWLTMSPHSLAEYESYVVMWVYQDDYGISTDAANNLYGVRPVINLKSDVELKGGNGTVDNPYVIKTN